MNLHAPGTLFCCAHPSEAKALPSGLLCLVTGVGKVASTACLSDYVARHRVDRVFIFGVAGVYPNPAGRFDDALPVGALAWVTQDTLLDEGVALDEGFLDLQTLSLLGDAPLHYQADPAWMRDLQARTAWPMLHGATVSSCAGRQDLACARAQGSSASLESMEGAAMAHVCMRAAIPWVQLRAVSNRCTTRAQGRWDLALALENLAKGLSTLLENKER